MTIGERIKYYRLAAGLTQQELADKIGVKLAAVSKYELGTVDNLPISRVERIADALGVTGGQIMGWEESDMIDGEIFVPVVAEIAEISPTCSIIVAIAMGAITSMALTSNLAIRKSGNPTHALSAIVEKSSIAEPSALVTPIALNITANM